MPYREDKPLTDLIPPDRRRQKTIALVVGGMIAGAAGLWVFQQLDDSAKPPVVVKPPAKEISATLEGPEGKITVPFRNQTTVVHVWLQGCADCMPAFEAMKKEAPDFGPNVVNVAYGRADPAWAEEYGVRKNLVYDLNGARVVKPLGITSFTTLVFDERGQIVARDRPDQAGYVERVAKLVNGGPLTPKDVQDVVDRERRAVKVDCWNRYPDVKEEDVTVGALVSGGGRVLSSTVHGRHPDLDKCVEDVVKSWRFRATGGASVQVDIPFKLRRE